MSRQVFFLWILLIGVILLSVMSVNLKRKNKKLIEKNSTLVLQNDSIISANLQFEKELKELQNTIDSIQQNPPVENDRLSSKNF